MINLRKQLIIHKNLLNKQTDTIKQYRKKRVVINIREKKMIEKLFKLIQELNVRKKITLKVTSSTRAFSHFYSLHSKT